MSREIYGITEAQELDTRKIYKRQIPFWKSLLLDISMPDVACVLLVMSAAVYWIWPEYADFSLLFALSLGVGTFLRHRFPKLFIALPMWCGLEDHGMPQPGRKKWKKAEGILLLGNANGTNDEIWARDTEAKTHTLVLGTTGAGKTVSLQSMSYNYFAMASGLVYVDPKASPNLAIELFIMARRLGRDDDFRVINFITGGRKPEKITPFRASNTINPFAFGSADSLVNLLTSLLPKSEGGNAVFQQKAVSLISGLIPILVSLRDKNIALPMSQVGPYAPGQFGSGLSIVTIRDYLDPVLCVSLCYPAELKEELPSKYGKPAARYREIMAHLKRGGTAENCRIPYSDWPECCRIYQHVERENVESMIAVLSALNFEASLTKEIGEQKAFTEQYGYAKGYFAQTLVSLSGTYGHIFNVSAGEVDMQDVLLSRRIMVAMLPSMEKSPTEIENLGKIVLSAIKNAVSVGLGSRLEGLTEQTLGALPSASRCPSGIVVDEYAAIMTPGFATILTQARSLGFAAIIASQDYAGMKGADEKEAEQIIANTKIKLFMTIVEAKQTWELARDLFGKAQIEEANLGEMNERGQIKAQDRISQEDLMSQIEGEFHMFYRGKLVRGATPYMVPSTKGKQTRIARMIPVDMSREQVLLDLAENNAA